MKKFMKEQKAITLIALVITIIVLLILAGIAITMLTGDNSILKRAGESKTETERKSVIESAQVDILGQLTDNKGTSISKQQLIDILGKYFENAEDINETPDDKIKETELQTKSEYGNYTITIGEIYKGTFGAAEVTNLKRLQNYFVGRKPQDLSNDGITFNHIDGEDMPDENKIHYIKYDSDELGDFYIIQYKDEFYKVYYEGFENESLPEDDYNRYDSKYTDVKETTCELEHTINEFKLYCSIDPSPILMDIVEKYLPKMIVEGKEIDLTPYLEESILNNRKTWCINLPYDSLSIYNGKEATVTLSINGTEVKWTGVLSIQEII